MRTSAALAAVLAALLLIGLDISCAGDASPTGACETSASEQQSKSRSGPGAKAPTRIVSVKESRRAGAVRLNVVKSPAYPDVHYTARRGGCRVTWVVYRSELNRGVVKHRAECSETLVAALPILAKVLGAVLEREGTEALQTLFWGRLAPAVEMPRSRMSRRLALAAHRSLLWDARRGRPREGHANPAVIRMANEYRIYGELEGLFASYGLKIEVSGAEKVIRSPARDLQYAEWLYGHGIEPQEILPCDAMLHFAVRPKEPHSVR